MQPVRRSRRTTDISKLVYHIHQQQVPPDGNCDETGAHLDPFERGEMPPCNPDLPQTCQVGDLAGKHGAITSTPFRTTYSDDYTAVSAQYLTCLTVFTLGFWWRSLLSPRERVSFSKEKPL